MKHISKTDKHLNYYFFGASEGVFRLRLSLEWNFFVEQQRARIAESLPPSPNLVPESFVEVHVDRLRTEFDMVCGATACQSAEQFAKNTRSIIHSVQCSVAG